MILDTRRRWLAIVGAVLATAPGGGFAQANESLTRDPATGDYILTYCCDSAGNMEQAILESSAKVTPTVASWFSVLGTSYLKYDYEIFVETVSKKGLNAFRLDPVSSIKTAVAVPARRADVSRADWAASKQALAAAMASPQGWQATGTLSNKAPGLRLSWRTAAQVSEPAAPGSRVTGFGFESADLPGVAIGQFTSRASAWAFGDQGPGPGSAVGQQMAQLEENDFVLRYVAAPLFAVPNPFNAVSLLEKIRDHVKGWPPQQLMDQAFWQKIDGFLAGAISAARAGDKTTAATKLAQIRAELRAKYPDLDAASVLEHPTVTAASPAEDRPALPPVAISQLPVRALNDYNPRLAARVLDFDSAYVMRRMN